jgi:hypothetical protein
LRASRVDIAHRRAALAQRARSPLHGSAARNVGFLTKTSEAVSRSGTFALPERFVHALESKSPASRGGQEAAMHSIIYIIGLIVVIMAILSLFGLR